MGILDSIKPNEVLTNIFDYKMTIAGRPKAGKTSLVYKIVKEEFDGDVSKLLLVAFERGYNALRGIHATDIKNWDEFIELVDELEETAVENGYKVLAIDTVDLMAKRATEYMLKKRSRKDKKKYETLSDIPWGGGYDLLEEEVNAQISRLDYAGYGLIFITHDKDKKFETKDGISYDKTVMSVSGRVGDLIKNTSDFIVFIEIAKELENGNAVDKRYIHFRGTGDMEAGGRFENIKDKIEYDTTDFINTIKDAILAEYDGDEDALAEASERQTAKKENALKENKTVEKPDEDLVEDLYAEIFSLITGMTKEEKISWGEEIENRFGTKNYKVSKDVEKLSKLVEDIKNA